MKRQIKQTNTQQTPYGRCSLAMFKLPPVKRDILIYLDLRSNLNGWNFNVSDIVAVTCHSETKRWTPSFGQENAEIKLGSQALLD